MGCKNGFLEMNELKFIKKWIKNEYLDIERKFHNWNSYNLGSKILDQKEFLIKLGKRNFLKKLTVKII